MKSTKKISIWLDDDWADPEMVNRHPPEGWVPAKTAQEAIDLIRSNEVEAISFDHDLGPEDSCGNGYLVATFIEDCYYHGLIQNRIKWDVHSANSAGRLNIIRAMESADRIFDRRGQSD